jgi:hypothetical protein
MYKQKINHQDADNPFWMLVRWEGKEDLCDAEREEAAKLGITDFDDFGLGLCYNRKEDAEKIAAAMTHRFGITFGIDPPKQKEPGAAYSPGSS